MNFLRSAAIAAAIAITALLPCTKIPDKIYAENNLRQVTFSSLDPSVNDGEPIKGVDISSIIAIEKAGVEFYSKNGEKQDIFKTLADSGVNYIRVRVWNEPWDSGGNSYGGGNNDLNVAAEIGKRASKYGLKLLVDIQYSDFWADPGKQTRPKYWQQHDHETLKYEIYRYTKWVLETITENGGNIGMVQVGNETNCFFCGEKDMYKICDLFASGNKAVREFDPDILIAHHFANPASGNYEWYAKVMNECKLDYDVFATSYYPYWHGTTENLTSVLKSIADKYGKYVMVAETAYPYTNDDGDTFGNAVTSSSSDVDLRYDISVDGQAQCLTDVFQAVANVGEKGIGVFYWEPAWLGVNGISWEEQHKLWTLYGSGWATEYAQEYDKSVDGAGGSSYDNQALFDFKGHPLESIKVFENIYPQTKPPVIKGSVIKDGNYRIRNLSSGLYLTIANGSAEAGSNVIQYMADGAADYNTWSFIPCGSGYYEICSNIGDGKTFKLDLDSGNPDNRTNIGIYTDTHSDAQKFKLIENSDGSYMILTKSSSDRSAIEIENALDINGGNVQQFEVNGHECQKWILEPVEEYFMTGDINNDGDINIYDVVFLRKALSAGYGNKACDINGDGKISETDLTSIHNYILGKEGFSSEKHGTPPNTIFPKV